jgi:GTP-binding protein
VSLPYASLQFLTGAASPRGLPPDEGVEAAFAGRSNAGKSSALNAVAGRRALARTSKTPGRTQEINFFSLDEGRRLVDLPGYGFARAPEGAKRRWGRLVEDLQMVRWCVESGVALHAVLTKADKLGRGAARGALAGVRKELAPLGERVSTQLFSATRGDGLELLRERLEAWLSGAAAGDGPPGGPGA